MGRLGEMRRPHPSEVPKRGWKPGFWSPACNAPCDRCYCSETEPWSQRVCLPCPPAILPAHPAAGHACLKHSSITSPSGLCHLLLIPQSQLSPVQEALPDHQATLGLPCCSPKSLGTFSQRHPNLWVFSHSCDELPNVSPMRAGSLGPRKALAQSRCSLSLCGMRGPGWHRGRENWVRRGHHVVSWGGY